LLQPDTVPLVQHNCMFTRSTVCGLMKQAVMVHNKLIMR
jgi:hypothetical protein